MRIFLLIITTILYLTTFNSINIHAEEIVYDCKKLCPEIDWQSSGETHFGIEDIIGCNFIAYWSYRYVDCGGGGWCDFKLDSVGGYPSYCVGNYPFYQLIQNALLEVIKAEAFKTSCFQSLPPFGSTTLISINYASCWRLAPGDPMQDMNGLVICDETQCCRRVWKLTKSWDGGLAEPPELIAIIGLNPICPGLECIAVCEEYPLPQIPTSTEENYNSESGFKTKVYPNPTKNILNVQIISDTEGEHEIEVYDNVGNLIFSESFIKQQKDQSIQLNMSKLSTGNYRYVIKYNEIFSISGVFNVVK